MRRHPDIAIAAAAVLSVAALGFALRPQHTPLVTGAPAAPVARMALPEPRHPTALIISDAYTSTSGAADTSYACKAATAMGWLCKLAAEPGTGYISGGTANRFPINQGSGHSTSFGERMTNLATLYRPDVVILDGGRDDVFAPPVARFQVTVSAIWQAHQTWPNARIVFVKPRFLGRPDDDLGIDPEIEGLLREASDVKDLVVIDPILQFRDTDTRGLISLDGTNPNRAGERALTEAFVRALEQNGFQPAT